MSPPLKVLLLAGGLHRTLAESDLKQLFRASAEITCLLPLVRWTPESLRRRGLRALLLVWARLEDTTDYEDDGDFERSPSPANTNPPPSSPSY